MIYVMSDIHGCYDEFQEMLDTPEDYEIETEVQDE